MTTKAKTDRAERNADIVGMVLHNVSLKDIAEAVGLSYSQVRSILLKQQRKLISLKWRYGSMEAAWDVFGGEPVVRNDALERARLVEIDRLIRWHTDKHRRHMARLTGEAAELMSSLEGVG